MKRPQPVPPQPGQESVWDYPRPAKLEDTDKHIKIIFNDVVIADTSRAKRVLETSHPPSYYIPSEDIALEYVHPTSRQTMCEWKGICKHYSIVVAGKSILYAGWSYFAPTPDFVDIQDHYSFYARPMDACYVNDELVTPQAGDMYGGWITSDIVGPFKGEPGTMGW